MSRGTWQPPIQSMVRRRRRRVWGWLFALLLLMVAAIGGTLVLGGDLLVAPDPLPDRAQVAVALAGSTTGGEARRAEARRLLEAGQVGHVVFDVGQVRFWGEWMPDLARRHVAQTYGEELAARVSICEMKADSTAEELVALRGCLQERGLRSVVLVTSNYHTRRVRMLSRRIFSGLDPPVSVAVHGVPDGDFESSGWWRRRRHAKTWLEETTKLVWNYLFFR